MRCLFTMFAEDVGLLRRGSFRDLLAGLKGQAHHFAHLMSSLWRDMDKGGFSPVLREDVLRFNGGLFADSEAIDLDEEQEGLVRWLRPEFQAGAAPGPAQREMAILAPLATADGRHAWPAALPDQFRLVRTVLAGEGAPVAAPALAARFRRVRRDRLAAVLDTLVSLGQARRTEAGRYTA